MTSFAGTVFVLNTFVGKTVEGKMSRRKLEQSGQNWKEKTKRRGKRDNKLKKEVKNANKRADRLEGRDGEKVNTFLYESTS